jgi:hypothetical protein
MRPSEPKATLAYIDLQVSLRFRSSLNEYGYELRNWDASIPICIGSGSTKNKGGGEPGNGCHADWAAAERRSGRVFRGRLGSRTQSEAAARLTRCLYRLRSARRSARKCRICAQAACATCHRALAFANAIAKKAEEFACRDGTLPGARARLPSRRDVRDRTTCHSPSHPSRSRCDQAHHDLISLFEHDLRTNAFRVCLEGKPTTLR